MAELNTGIELILEGIKTKSCAKQDVYSNTITQFNRFKTILNDITGELNSQINQIDKRIEISTDDIGPFEIQLKFAGDILLFTMHSNVFNFKENHELHKSKYVSGEPTRSYCGMISIHNFLADSYKYQRLSDLGYLIARIFINKENHFFVEGHRQLGFLYNDFENAKINEVYIKAIIESAILYSLDFELLIPPFDANRAITVQQMKIMSVQAGLKTSKRPGFKFSYEENKNTST